MYEAWCSLDGWPKDPTNVGAVLEPKAATGGAISYTFGNLQRDVIKEINVFCIVDYESVFWLESECDKIKCIFVRPLSRIFEIDIITD